MLTVKILNQEKMVDKLDSRKEEALKQCLSGFKEANSFLKKHQDYPSKVEQLRKEFYRAVRILKPNFQLRH